MHWLTPLSKWHVCGVRCAHWGVGWHKNSHNTWLEREVSELKAALFSELLISSVSPLPGDLLDLSAIFKLQSYNIVDNFPSSLRQGHFLRDSKWQRKTFKCWQFIHNLLDLDWPTTKQEPIRLMHYGSTPYLPIDVTGRHVRIRTTVTPNIQLSNRCWKERILQTQSHHHWFCYMARYLEKKEWKIW